MLQTGSENPLRILSAFALSQIGRKGEGVESDWQ